MYGTILAALLLTAKLKRIPNSAVRIACLWLVWFECDVEMNLSYRSLVIGGGHIINSVQLDPDLIKASS
jgi:hypothetical protein